VESFDVVVVGAGLAGLEVARCLSRDGLGVLLVDRKSDLSHPVHTTGIFVRKTLEDYAFPPGCLGPAIRHVTLQSANNQTLHLSSSKDEFRVGDMPRLYGNLLEEAQTHGAIFSDSTHYRGSSGAAGGSIVSLERGGWRWEVRTRLIVGADGAVSGVARDLGLDRNREFIIGIEDVFTGVPLVGEPRFHVFLDARLAPGYIAWVVHDGETVHIGTGGYADRFDARVALETLKKRCESLFDFGHAQLLERRGGRIPVGGLLPRISNARGLLVGDAAGAVSPLTAGGLDPAIRLSRHAARVIGNALQPQALEGLRSYQGAHLRKRFTSRLWLRSILRTVSHPLLLELGFGVLKHRPFKRVAEQVFFGRGSFPEVELGSSGTR
jgi:flavin-dependent dehydrogenase